MMRGNMNVKTLTAAGKKMSLAYELKRPMAFVHLGIAAVLLGLGIIFHSSELIALVPWFSIIPVITGVMYALGKLLYRDRIIGESTISANRYASIKDELRIRKIRSAKKFLIDNPDHFNHFQELGKKLMMRSFDGIHKIDQIIAFQSLVYATDMTPENSAEAIITIISERGITDPDKAREMLREFNGTGTPLLSGAL